jgi:peptidoglycan hydrolase-like protein with peptidoglycan-binding domain
LETLRLPHRRRTAHLRASIAALAFVFLLSVVPSAASAAVRHLGDRALRAGMHGKDVRVLQDYLTRAGYKTRVDGNFGRTTARRLRSFERAHALRVDGVLAPEDIDALRAAASGATLAPSPSPPPAAPPAAAPPAPAPPPVPPATLNADGTATPPAGAPPAVVAIITAGNVIAHFPYRYGGGHRRWADRAYDCSGSVSYALRGATLLTRPLDSGSFMTWGDAGPGAWVTIYTKSSHAFMVVAGLRFDTSGRSRSGSRWQSDMRSPRGYVVRHPAGL